MQIEQVIAGVNGDVSAQAIQLRMRANGQEQVHRARLLVWDANGQNPIVLIDYDAVMANALLGSRVLAVSAALAEKYTDPAISADFILTNVIPPSYLAAGSITFEKDDGELIVARVSWGRANYHGPTTGAQTNDSDGEFGPPFDGPLPSTSLQAIMFQGAAEDLMTANDSDFALTGAAAVLTNNAGLTFTVTELQCPNDPDEDADGDFICGDVDNCPRDANTDQADADGDGFGDVCDGCPADPLKTVPARCGCGMPDADLNGNGGIDCLEPAPSPGDTDGGEPPDEGDPNDPSGPDGGDPDTGGPDDGDATSDSDPEDNPADEMPSGDTDTNGTDGSEPPQPGADGTNASPPARPPVACGLGIIPVLPLMLGSLLFWRSPPRHRSPPK